MNVSKIPTDTFFLIPAGFELTTSDHLLAVESTELPC